MICDNSKECFFELLKTPQNVTCKQKIQCIDFCDTRKEAVCRERGKLYRLNNGGQRKILSLHVDGGVVIVDRRTPQNIAKCDYLYLIDSEPAPIGILIELKGIDIKKGIEQIESTLTLFNDALRKCNRVYGRIAFAGGTPKLQNIPTYMSLQRKLKQRGGNLMAAEKLSDEVDLLK